MAFTDYGLIQLGSFTKGDNPTYPNYLCFGSDSSIDLSKSYMGSEFYRKAITWSWSGNRPKGYASLLSTEGNGSVVYELGVAGGSVSLGSTLYIHDSSAVGEKNNTFDVSVTFEVRYSRP